MDFSDQTLAEVEALLESLKQGNDSAFNNLVTRCEGRLRELTARMLSRYPHVRRWEDTDDVFQLALIRLHRALSAVQPGSAREFFGLASVQVRRTLIDLARHYFGVYGPGTHHHSNPDGQAADDPGAGFDQAAKKGSGFEPESLEEWTAFHEATNRLPDEEREVFELTWYAGLTQPRIAELLGVSQRTVIRRLQRARLLLRQMLVDESSAVSTRKKDP